MFGHNGMKQRRAFIEAGIVPAVGKAKLPIELYHIPEELDAAVRAFASDKVEWSIDTFDRKEREARQAEVEKETLEHFADIYPENTREIKDSLYYPNQEQLRSKILDKGIRPDRSGLQDVLPLWSQRHVLPRVPSSLVLRSGHPHSPTTPPPALLLAPRHPP